MKPAFVLLAFAFWISFVIVLTGWLEVRRDRDIVRCCPVCAARAGRCTQSPGLSAPAANAKETSRAVR